ncbi:MAG: HEAT repeat domain-containing protein [Crocosphaera sp.]|nr:HEAT repeat domain-containing protein [Crocosphaera sp.]
MSNLETINKNTLSSSLSLEHTQTIINALSIQLEDKNPDIRAKSAEALGKVSSELALQVLIAHIHNQNAGVRLNIIQALGNIMEGLDKIENDSLVPNLVNYINDSNPYIRTATVETLGKIGSEEAVNYLIQSLQDHEATVRATAAKSLGQIGSQLAINSLIQAFHDQDEMVRIYAIEAVGKIVDHYSKS